MSFISPEFCYLALIFFGIYWYLQPKKIIQTYFLTLTSYLFYATWSIKFTATLFFYSLIIWLLGKWVSAEKHTQNGKSLKLSIAICISLSLLLITKYYEFAREIVDEVFNAIGIVHQLPFVELLVPAGISFFTFQAITYLVWQSKNESQVIKKQMSFRDVLLFLAFWPTLFAGPIFRAKDFFAQLYGPNSGNAIHVEKAIYFILLGLFQKVVLSNWLATTFVDDVFTYPDKQNLVTATSGTWAYALQIFFDFSGYTLLVTGLGYLLGYEIPLNFRQPYLAKNLQDFWKRWHISLSTFIRDYIYIPLGGNQGSFTKTQINIFIAMTISGIWHGASLTFVIWGVLHALGVVFSNFNQYQLQIQLNSFLTRLLTILFICLAWIFFRSENIHQAFELLRQFSNISGKFTIAHLELIVLTVLFYKLSFKAEPIENWFILKIKQYWGWRLFVVITAFVYWIIFAGPSGIPGFIYYRF
jgi:D-alanyl-lipoteichoic acid acyltransferase DltB (MBOAT superfamily)